MSIEDLIQKKSAARAKLLVTKKKLDHIQQLYYMLESRYHTEKRNYESIDRQLAELDGRLTKVKKRSDIQVALTKDQVLAIAAKLGFSLCEDDFNDDENEEGNEDV